MDEMHASEIRLQAVPILRIHSLQAAQSFYCDLLGFGIDWEHYYGVGAPVYMQVSRAGLRLQLSQNERFQEGTIIFVGIQGIDRFHAELEARAVDLEIPAIAQTPWQTRQFELEDPFGNLLRFNGESL